MFNKLIILGTFIPWLIIYIRNLFKILNTGEFSFSYFKKHFLDIFRLDQLFLVIVFFYFASFNKEFVSIYLFLVMNLYLCVNLLYEKKLELSKSFYKDNLFVLIGLGIVSLIPFIIYFIKGNAVLTYRIMFLYLFFDYVIVVIIRLICKLFKRKK